MVQRWVSGKHLNGLEIPGNYILGIQSSIDKCWLGLDLEPQFGVEFVAADSAGTKWRSANVTTDGHATPWYVLRAMPSARAPSL